MKTRLFLALILILISVHIYGQAFAERKTAVPKEGPPTISLFNTATTVSINPATDYLFVYSAAAGGDRKALVSTVVGGAGGAHNLLSATHSDTTAGAVLRGDWITGVGATPKWERKGKCADSEFIGGDGTDMLCLNISPARAFGGIAAQASLPGTLQGSAGNTNFNIAGAGRFELNGLGATSSDAAILANITAASAGTTIQRGPAFTSIGAMWDDDGAAGFTSAIRLYAHALGGNTPHPCANLDVNDSGTWFEFYRFCGNNGAPFFAVNDTEGYIHPSGTSQATIGCTSSNECGVYTTTGPPGGARRLVATAIRTNVATKTANYTVTTLDSVLLADTTSGTITFTLPACSSTITGLRQSFVKTVAANTMTLDGNASETINGATTQSRTGQYSTIEIVCDSATTSWVIVSQSGS